METQLTLTELTSLLMAFTVAIQCMNSPVFAGDDDNDKDHGEDKDKNYTVIKSTASTTNHLTVSD